MGGASAVSVRIAGGAFAGRVLLGPPSRRGGGAIPGLRPTAARLRKSLFEVLGPELPGSMTLDVCAGVGTLGFEALSRGADRVWFLESDRGMAARIASNAARLGVTSFQVVSGDAARHLDRLAARDWRFEGAPGVVFVDPPWRRFRDGGAESLLRAALALGPALLVVAHEATHSAGDRLAPASRGGAGDGAVSPWYHRARTLRAGDSAASLYRPEARHDLADS